MLKSQRKRKEKASLENVPPLDGDSPAGAKIVVVESDSSIPYHVLLHQTDIGNNSNKFYLLQIWNVDQGNEFYVWRRWGRVGYNGQTQLMPFGSSRSEAVATFKQKYYDKTHNEWGNKNIKSDGPPMKKQKKLLALEHPKSDLHPSILQLIEMISDLNSMAQDLSSSLKFDANRAPLGKLTDSQIKAGYRALKKVAECISSGLNALRASNEYYTKIPHEFGMRVPPIIKSIEQLQNEIRLLETLGHVRQSYKIFKEMSESHPLEAKYKALGITLNPLDPEKDDEFSIVEQYIQSTHASTHNQYSMDVEQIFCVEKELKGRHKFKDVGQGLKIAPPEAPSTGYMFGKGVYFADISSKSANYCFATPSKNSGLLLLCEVALGECHELVEADEHANKLPKGKHSVKGLGPTEDTGVNNKNGHGDRWKKEDAESLRLSTSKCPIWFRLYH
ncbi:PARP2_3_4 [Lepeophtheirus salmonis]|uniref:PARP2_3_4 n=1 Tax=Lepeophtheirus salmonis TaxID=72036 RepID=A0A7R8CZ65_LEPSM|nr:PARP2_3_4 [Lepeophtheirus salmonis]CAF2947445.1 PARP2_3_4 [Lepeophtheirus salmonis]